MKTTTILFDLDGTLLPMDQDRFVNLYFDLMGQTLAPYGYDPDPLLYAVWKGTIAMFENDGSVTNEEAFWKRFNELMGKDMRYMDPLFHDFYGNQFNDAKITCTPTPRAAEVIKTIKKKGFRIALATNPVYPSIATENRIRWAGLDASDFDLFTVYENSCHCKPNPAYYQDVCNALGVSPEECVMVGNDAVEDTAAEKIGIRVFLLTDCLLNRDNRDISKYPQGNFDDLLKFIDTL